MDNQEIDKVKELVKECYNKRKNNQEIFTIYYKDITYIVFMNQDQTEELLLELFLKELTF